MINTTDKIGQVSFNGTPLEVDKDLATKTITQNGTYNATTVDSVDGYSEVTVNVSPNVGTKSITTNGTYTSSTDSLDGYSEVTVNVTAQPNLGTKTITENGTYAASSDSLDGFSSVTVNVSGGGGGSATLVTKSITSNGTYAASNDNADGYSSVTVNVPNPFNNYLNAKAGDASRLFEGTDLTDADFNAISSGVDWSDVTMTDSMFRDCPMIENINFNAAPEDISDMFWGCENLETITGLDFVNVYSMEYVFYGCTSLRVIDIQNIMCSFDISVSTQFTTASLQTIINNLADLTEDPEAPTATLTMGATNLAKLSQSDIAAANAKGWTLN